MNTGVVAPPSDPGVLQGVAGHPRMICRFLFLFFIFIMFFINLGYFRNFDSILARESCVVGTKLNNRNGHSILIPCIPNHSFS